MTNTFASVVILSALSVSCFGQPFESEYGEIPGAVEVTDNAIPLRPRRFMGADLVMTRDLTDPVQQHDFCHNSMNQLIPRVVTMKRMMVNGIKRSDPTLDAWRLQEWAQQLQDIERRLVICNRRNAVSKVRLL
ncbi:uncharacterized protein LOC131891399 [Tigriopus californicus]|uniref:uncharacterized protein LOC131891399 n=1 Tax=Tigriopus californicus TaxID=6832 RepID=UPI0027DA4F21|nr:uncharacterized protein LOC131891399 [Tigriopus californicus]